MSTKLRSRQEPHVTQWNDRRQWVFLVLFTIFMLGLVFADKLFPNMRA